MTDTDVLRAFYVCLLFRLCIHNFDICTVSLQVIIMQKYYRRWLAKRYVDKLKRDKQARIEFERLEEIRKRKEKEDRVKREFERRMNPKTKEDFDLLYAALESECDPLDGCTFPLSSFSVSVFTIPEAV